MSIICVASANSAIAEDSPSVGDTLTRNVHGCLQINADVKGLLRDAVLGHAGGRAVGILCLNW